MTLWFMWMKIKLFFQCRNRRFKFCALVCFVNRNYKNALVKLKYLMTLFKINMSQKCPSFGEMVKLKN